MQASEAAPQSRSGRSVAFSADGTRLPSGSSDGAVRHWDAFTDEELGALRGHRFGVRSVAFSPDGTRLASVSVDEILRSRDTSTANVLGVLWEDESARHQEVIAGMGQ